MEAHVKQIPSNHPNDTALIESSPIKSQSHCAPNASPTSSESLRAQRLREAYFQGKHSKSSHALDGKTTSFTGLLSNNTRAFSVKMAQLSIKDDSADQRRRKRVARVLYNPVVESVIGAVTIYNFVVILIDTDIKAAKEDVPVWIRLSSLLCLSMYTIELIFRVFVERWKVFEIAWNWLDMFVVTTGIVGEICDTVDVELINLTFLRVFRCFRLLRIFKALVLARQMRELRKFIRSIISCIKTLLWGFILVILFMTMWSCLAVELLNPYMKKVYDRTPEWKECERCERSFTSIWSSNLTFFQTIVAGDSWGRVAIPVIEAYPWTVFVFVGSLFTLLVGILNLIVAVLVDTAAEARREDTAARAQESSYAERREKRHLEKLFRQIDADDSGTVTLDELEWGAEEVPELSQILRVMDIQGEDLQQLFMMLDENGLGEINPHEFIEQLYRLKCGDHKTAATFAKHYVANMKKTQSAMLDKLETLESQIRSLKKELRESSDSDDDDYAGLMTKEYETCGAAKMAHADKINQKKLLNSFGSLDGSRSKINAERVPLVVPWTPKEEDPLATPVLTTPKEMQPRQASLTSWHGASAPSTLRSSGSPKHNVSSISNTSKHNVVPCLPGSRQIVLSRDLREAEDAQFIALEHQFMQESLLCLLDEAEKKMTSSLRQQIKADLQVVQNELSESVCPDVAQDSSGNGKAATHNKVNDSNVFDVFFERIDQQLCMIPRQALQPIRNWRAIAEWAEEHQV